MEEERVDREFEQILAMAKKANALDEWIDDGDRYEFHAGRETYRVAPDSGVEFLRALVRRSESDHMTGAGG